ncbi:hypothetical protein M8494_21850 [Serratia ureilytica]
MIGILVLYTSLEISKLLRLEAQLLLMPSWRKFDRLLAPFKPVGSAGGVKLIGTMVQGNFTSAENAQRVSFIGGHVTGDFAMHGSLCNEYGATVLGERTNSRFAASLKINSTNPPQFMSILMCRKYREQYSVGR